MKKLISCTLILALVLALCPMALASESTNVWEAVESEKRDDGHSNVWAAYDPDAQPDETESSAAIDWAADKPAQTAGSTVANAGDVTPVTNLPGTLPSSTQGVVASEGYDMPYAIKVDRTNQVITVFSASEPGVYNVIEKQFICSTGTSKDPTPAGVFSLPDTRRKEWRYFKTYDTYVRYAVHIKGNYFFHSLLYSEPDVSTLSKTSYRNLGKPVSHGCIRMLDEDVKWMAENCLADTMVFIMDCEKDEALRTSLLPPKM